MRRAICLCEPSVILAGTVGTWKFLYTPSQTLPKGTVLRFDLCSKGREVDWQLPSIDLTQSDNIICIQLESGEILPATIVASSQENSNLPVYQFVLPHETIAGSTLKIIVGASPHSAGGKGNCVQKVSQRRRTCHLYIDLGGKGKFNEHEAFHTDIRGGKLQNLRILCPSIVAKNKRFDLIIRFEDAHGNLTSRAPEDTLIELSYENLRENLNWKLFVPETGFITLPNLYFNEPGVYRIRLKNLQTKQEFISSPIKCFNETTHNVLWGLLHGESHRSDASENIETCLRHFRDECALNYYSVSPFNEEKETSSDTWKKVSHSISEYNEEDRFVTFLGFQMVGEATDEGLRHLLYRKDNKPIHQKKDPKTDSVQKIYKMTLPKDMIAVPSFTMGPKESAYNFEQFSPEFERVVEIYNAWGSSECTVKEGNVRPIQINGKPPVDLFPEGSIRAALNKNRRFGFVAGGLDDRGCYRNLYEQNYTQYTPGLTAVVAEKYTREAIFDALYNRSCYATTGEKIILGFTLAGAPMGAEIETNSKPGLLINRHIAGYVAATANITKIEILRNGIVIKTFSPKTMQYDYQFDDMDPLEKYLLEEGDEKPPFAYYYIRVTQEDGHVAWSSPIWIDHLSRNSSKKLKR
jgi:hypothetical protein